jgi:tetratricopeptide (TPR) repeat protein
MITLHDGKPVPKIIDFGIAKATQVRLTEKTLFTEYKRFIGTPAYMSPEQAEMSGLDVDTRSDIYSLGVLLYELLTGDTPLEAQKLRSAAYDEMCRMIRETDPPKPSTRLSALGEMLAEVAKHRHAQPGELCKIVRGDLDWVVMKTLEKDRTRRYETANELAADIERHLRDQPVVAGPPSTGYRLRKFVRRNRVAVMVGCLVALVVLVAVSVLSASTIMVWREKERTKAALAREEDQRERSEADFKLARDVLEAMTRAADQQSNRDPAGGRWLLQEAEVLTGQLLEKRSDEPAAREQAGLAYDRLGRIHDALGEHKEAEQAYGRAIDLFEKLAEDFPETARYHLYIVETVARWGRSLNMLGRRKEAAGIMPARREKMKGLVRRFPDNSSYRKMLVTQCEHQDGWQLYEDTIALFEDLLAGHPSCRYELARLLICFDT